MTSKSTLKIFWASRTVGECVDIFTSKMNNQLWLTQRALNKGQQTSLLSVLVVHFSQSSAIEDEIATLRDLVGKVVKKVLQKVSLLFGPSGMLVGFLICEMI